MGGGDILFTGTSSGTDFDFTGGILTNVDVFDADLIQNGGTLAPGASPGTMIITGNYDQWAGIYEVEIDSTNPADVDYLDITGYAHLDGTLKLVFGYTPSIGDKFNVLEADGGILYTPGFGISSDVLTTGGLEFGTTIVDGRILQLTLVPEPTTLLVWSLLAGLGVGLGWRRRKR
jgi:hypothetical protein